MQLKNNCTRNSQNCTWLRLVQLLDCYLYNYSIFARKSMWLPIQIIVFVYNHTYLYEDVMPAFLNSTYFFLFHVTFDMLFLLIFCILSCQNRSPLKSVRLDRFCQKILLKLVPLDHFCCQNWSGRTSFVSQNWFPLANFGPPCNL